ncbi:hypothetical protein [Lactobacillus helveticus]|uniref:hypothetical protein n=1 Tax=Lactobacillus helveticus TaxID=1587 RepID=UPI001C65099B|nr:hypothetical protein [Lactobacillus helveticus]MBW7988308.1 hypothetical protein [Lactobacillus helveticus]
MATKIKATKGLTENDVFNYFRKHAYVLINGKSTINSEIRDKLTDDQEKQLNEKIGFSDEDIDEARSVDAVTVNKDGREVARTDDSYMLVEPGDKYTVVPGVDSRSYYLINGICGKYNIVKL